MSKEMKYIIINESSPILFGMGTNHSDVGRGKVTSAGKCRIYFEGGKFVVDCYDESISLNLRPDEKDQIRIEMMLNNY